MLSKNRTALIITWIRFPINKYINMSTQKYFEHLFIIKNHGHVYIVWIMPNYFKNEH